LILYHRQAVLSRDFLKKLQKVQKTSGFFAIPFTKENICGKILPY